LIKKRYLKLASAVEKSITSVQTKNKVLGLRRRNFAGRAKENHWYQEKKNFQNRNSEEAMNAKNAKNTERKGKPYKTTASCRSRRRPSKPHVKGSTEPGEKKKPEAKIKKKLIEEDTPIGRTGLQIVGLERKMGGSTGRGPKDAQKGGEI